MEKVRSESTVESYPLPIINHGLASLDELFADRVIYRKLEPVGRRWSGLKSARYHLGINDDVVPRKLDDSYGEVALWILEQMQTQRNASLSEILFIGDTLSGDGAAYRTMRRISGLPASAFIGHERADEPAAGEVDPETAIYTANRWSLLADWLDWTLGQGLVLGENTAVVIDMDKTAIGARGRNDRAIDAARLKGLYRTVGSVLGDAFDPKLFEKHYDALNRSQYHHITEDNQDYLAYICLVLNNDAIDCFDLLERIDSGAIDSFQHFVRYVETCIASGTRVSEAMRQSHEAVNASVHLGDPTPFKRFRREEFTATLEQMNNLPDDIEPAARLTSEITITQEVRECGLWLGQQGCLVVSLSDKPDEASVPDRPRAKDHEPIHRARTHAVGVSIQDRSDALRSRLP